jgi:hypothetical protein
MTRGRALDPSRVNQCPDCARDCFPTDLGIAEHRALHLDWHVQHGPIDGLPSNAQRVEAWRTYAHALEKRVHDLKEQCNTRDDCIADWETRCNDAWAELDTVRGIS